LDEPGKVLYRVEIDSETEPDSDVHVLRIDRQVSVTPMSLDTTSRVALDDIEARLRRS
jgi:broad specificity polyphosphatase/5'/3'-nucleotidase SurE